jgi:hypothetical protein
MHKKSTTVLLITMLLLASSGIVRGQQATLSLLPSAEQIGVDSVLIIVVEISDVQHLHAYSVDITYDTVFVHFQSLQRLPFFSGSTFFASNVDSAGGKIVLNEAVLGPSGQSGTGGLALVRFVGIRPGIASFQISASALRDTVNASIPVTNKGTVVTVGKPAGIKGLQQREQSPALRVGSYPNPFNGTTMIVCALPAPSDVRVELLNVLGERIRRLEGMHWGKGEHVIRWDGRGDDGQPAPSGPIFVRIEAGEASATMKILLIR